MPEKDPGLHKDIASIFQDLSVKDKEQQKPSENDESEQENNIFSELLTPSHLISETDESQETVQEQTEKSADSSDTLPETNEQVEEQKIESISEEISEPAQETAKDQQPDAADETPAPEIVQAKVVAPMPVAQLSGIRKVLQDLQNKLLAPKPGVDPKRQKLMIVLIPVLFVILIVVFTQVFKSPAKNINAAATTD
ncbi:MAG: hypothetical protein ACYSTX_00860, partial [Planctomycetota bacterium]